MPYEVAVQQIEAAALEMSQRSSEKTIEQAKRVCRIVYETFPDLDENHSPWSYMTVIAVEEGIRVEIFLPDAIFYFDSKDDGNYEFTQLSRSPKLQNVELKESVKDLTDKEITKRIKRKRFPPEPKQHPLTA